MKAGTQQTQIFLQNYRDPITKKHFVSGAQLSYFNPGEELFERL
jgi:hypothetical protein